MASAEVLSKPAVSSKNKKNLEAGRRKLEEFRKKKAQSKNGKLKNQASTDDAVTYEKQSAENGQTSTVDSVSTQNDGGYSTVTGTSGLSDNSSKLNVTSHYYGSESIPLAHVDTQSDKFREPDSLQKLPRHGENNHEAPGLNYQTGPNFTSRTYYSDVNTNSSTEIGEGIFSDLISSSRPIASQDSSSSDSHKISYDFDKDVSSSVSFPYTNVGSYDVGTKGYNEGIVTTISHQEPDSVYSTKSFQASAPEPGHSHQEFKNHLSVALEERNPSNAVYNFASLGSQRTSESYSTGFKSTVGGLFNGPTYSPENESYVRRSRPSFLDSLNIKNSSVSGRSFVDTDKTMNSEISSSNVAVSSAFHSSFSGSSPTLPLHIPASSNPSGNMIGNASKGHNLFEQRLESKLDHASQKQNEDFAALEQHIEDLTQEKFSLQRALEASKSLAESLAAENSSLTESYNQQASTVSQLKADMEGLQEEIKARLVELEAVKAEYMNAQLECNAADERAKLLASEVISLEEKALRLRSSELKLERELENSSAEIASYKKKISTLDKERRDLLETINALQEEKKLLQSKLRRASASGISVDFSKGHTKKDASTSTNDIGPDAAGDSSEHASTSMQTHDSVDNMLLLQDILADQENFALNIPPDQVQMIQNIDSLIAEINSEKKELMQALIAEVSTSTKLKELNKELSQKLEVQTQRLELLTAQSMASEFAATKQAPIAEIVRESVAYADEGDEVVERVLGWIMKLFPGGPSKRRTSRL